MNEDTKHGQDANYLRVSHSLATEDINMLGEAVA